jgi:hypothetical protein
MGKGTSPNVQTRRDVVEPPGEYAFLRNITWVRCAKCEQKLMMFNVYRTDGYNGKEVEFNLIVNEKCPHRAWHTQNVCALCRKKKRKERARKHARKQKRRR